MLVSVFKASFSKKLVLLCKDTQSFQYAEDNRNYL